MTAMVYGSDVAVSALGRLGIDHVAFNPGASFRGLHESMVHAGVQRPVLCLSEGVAVAAAHGFAKAAGRPMGVFLHNLVGLQAGSMAMFNAWVDQASMVVVGGSGPADRTRRRPYIDWIHTASPQAAVVRDYIKWDDEPASMPALLESLSRAHRIATTAPHGPTYVAFDALLQEAEAPPVDPQTVRVESSPGFTAPPADLEMIVARLRAAEQPVILADYVGRSRPAYESLCELADITAVPVVDLAGRHSFSNAHPRDGTPHRRHLIRRADFVLALDVRDLRWAVSDVDVDHRTSQSLLAPNATIVSIGLSDLRHRGFIETEGVVAGEHTALLADTAVALPQLAALAREAGTWRHRPGQEPMPDGDASVASGGTAPIDDEGLAASAFRAVREGPWQLAHGLLRGAVRRHWRLDRWNCHLGGSGGGGLGYGVGATIGAALAADHETLTVALQPEGDLLYTASGLWTAAHERLPILTIVVNNRSYGQDRMHQTAMSRMRNRPAEHIPVGIDIEDPNIDFTALAAAQGVEGLGPVTQREDLDEVLQRAADIARNERRPILVDVHVAR